VLIRMQLSLPRDSRYVGVMREVAACVLGEFSLPDELVDDIRLAVTEACANAVRHAAGSGEYTVALSVGAGGCQIEVTDFGPGFPSGLSLDDDAVQDGDLPAETGRGLHLIRALVDDLQFVRDDDATRVVLVKRWDDLDFELVGASVDPNL
jgi:serine/threonine-protein kinase RsbW